MWEFVCDCGSKHIASGASIKNLSKKRKIISCGCYKKNRLRNESRKYDYSDGTWYVLYNEHKRTAKKRQLNWLQFQEYKDWLINNPNCWYCDEEPSERKYKYGLTIKANGIDRIDSFKGYVLNNIRTACEGCNKFKLAETEKEFFLKIKKIYLHHQDRIKNIGDDNDLDS